ncbi:xanthine dehydrogenase family protein molybdopterin-binding subunit [Alkaliphilus peptidifermentans]|uniref:Purine hydroxylase alpha subunit apoprotein n=1 Tax=Alkaliphilus peptidifermentans DSM 18978 TaxID=1120976 RepID=A0A1G5KVZ6_9FIRM|nr:molybdopterin cofactor-binding domain-containing protein [Alkaliphilus peptidifermentans]SCZ04785.1 purine hydroxylase alpha subunit apoprotein [Alkaliphilus peptidifermentans DSM 18978]
MKLEVVGQSVIRVDGLAKLRGKATYPQDLYMDNMLYGKTLRSIKPHANIRLNISKAEKMEGVIKILTYKDVPHNHYGVLFKDHEVFSSTKVRSIGDPLAFVVATSDKIATKALEEIEVFYEDLDAVFDPIEAMQDNAPKVHDKSNIVYKYQLRKGDVDKAFQQCDVIIEEEYKTSMVDHAFLQPEAGLAYQENETFVVCAATQYPHFDQLEIAEALEVPLEKVRVINPAVGGAFGGREDITMQIHLALATKLTGRPVKTIYSRQESFVAHSKRHPLIMKYKTGANKEGKLLAMEATIVGDTGAYASWAINILRKSGVHATGPYEIPNVKVDSYAVYTNNPFAGAMRGFGATQVPIAHEQQMDMLAEKLNINPIEFRLINCFRKGSTTATGQILEESIPLVECIEAVEKSLKQTTQGGV